MITVQFVAATAMSLFVFVMLANFVVDLYARGAIRAAVDEGARAGRADRCVDGRVPATARTTRSTISSAARCVRECASTVSSTPARSAAQATVVLHGWLPGIVPDWSFVLTGTAVKEREP